MNRMSLNKRQLAWAGVIGPILFVALFTIEGWLLASYEAASRYVSELALGLGGWIQDLNFIIFGLLLLIFTRSVAAEFPRSKASPWGVILLTIIALCYISFGFFVMDPVGTPQYDDHPWDNSRTFRRAGAGAHASKLLCFSTAVLWGHELAIPAVVDARIGNNQGDCRNPVDWGHEPAGRAENLKSMVGINSTDFHRVIPGVDFHLCRRTDPARRNALNLVMPWGRLFISKRMMTSKYSFYSDDL
jgi:hypothetical protein